MSVSALSIKSSQASAWASDNSFNFTCQGLLKASTPTRADSLKAPANRPRNSSTVVKCAWPIGGAILGLRFPYTGRHSPRARSTRSSRVMPHQPFGDAAGLVSALALDRDVPNQLLSLRDLFQRLQDGPRPNLRSGGNRRRETDFVQPVVDAHPDRQFD